MLVGLFYRVAVMYAASRIILALKRKNEGYQESRKLSEEEPVSSLSLSSGGKLADGVEQAARVMTVIVTYARLILIAGSSSSALCLALELTRRSQCTPTFCSSPLRGTRPFGGGPTSS